MSQQPWQDLAKTGGGELHNVKVIVTYATGVAWRKSPSYNDRLTEFSGPRKDTVLDGSLVQGYNENIRYLKVAMPAGNRYGYTLHYYYCYYCDAERAHLQMAIRPDEDPPGARDLSDCNPHHCDPTIV